MKTFTIVYGIFTILGAICTIIGFIMDKIPANMTIIFITYFILLMILVIIIIKYIKNKDSLIKNMGKKDLLIKELSNNPLLLQCKEIGITNAYFQRQYNRNEEIIRQKLRDAVRIDLFFTTGQGFFNLVQNEIIYAMSKNNAEVRVMIARKASPFLDSVGNIEKKYNERDEARDIYSEIVTVEKFIPDFRRRAENHGSINLKHFETEFRTSMILIESRSEKWGLITLTTPPVKAAVSAAFTVNDTENENTVYKQCKEHFNCVWDTLE